MSRPTKKSPKSKAENSTQAAEPSPTKKTRSHGDKKILSIAIDPALHSKLALLARCEGRSVTDLVVESVSRNLKDRIAKALEALRAEVE